jgi:8-oxo-dGTP pyrophosphatase MutT (NUDIX family)
MKNNITKIKDDLFYDERSAGGIVYKIDKGDVYWLVIKTIKSDKYQKMGAGGRVRYKEIFKFPKGHLNDREFLKAAAIREVEEEGRIKAQILSKIGSRDYIMINKFEKTKTVKRVTFFLMKYLEDSSLRHFDKEMVVDRMWLKYEDACDRLTYDSEKVLLGKARMRLGSMTKK